MDRVVGVCLRHTVTWSRAPVVLHLDHMYHSLGGKQAAVSSGVCLFWALCEVHFGNSVVSLLVFAVQSGRDLLRWQSDYLSLLAGLVCGVWETSWDTRRLSVGDRDTCWEMHRRVRPNLHTDRSQRVFQLSPGGFRRSLGWPIFFVIFIAFPPSQWYFVCSYSTSRKCHRYETFYRGFYRFTGDATFFFLGNRAKTCRNTWSVLMGLIFFQNEVPCDLDSEGNFILEWMRLEDFGKE